MELNKEVTTGVAEHFGSPSPAKNKMPWELCFAERKRRSKDPRMTKHTSDAEQWAGTSLAGIWKRLCTRAKSLNDWCMGEEEMTLLLGEVGITNGTLNQKLRETFDAKKTGKFNALVVCKQIELAMTTGESAVPIQRHCFDKVDRLGLAESIDLRFAASIQLANPAEGGGAAGGRKKGKKSALPLTMKQGATYEQVQAVLLAAESLHKETEGQLAFAEFQALWSDPNNAFLPAAFLGPILEACAALFAYPNSLPLVPLRWLVTAEPAPPPDDELAMHDADVLLLRELEAAGGEDAIPKKKEKKKKKDGASNPGTPR